MKKISDRVLIIETEHKNRTTCKTVDGDLHNELKETMQVIKLYERLMEAKYGKADVHGQ